MCQAHKPPVMSPQSPKRRPGPRCAATMMINQHNCAKEVLSTLKDVKEDKIYKTTSWFRYMFFWKRVLFEMTAHIHSLCKSQYGASVSLKECMTRFWPDVSEAYVSALSQVCSLKRLQWCQRWHQGYPNSSCGNQTNRWEVLAVRFYFSPVFGAEGHLVLFCRSSGHTKE